MAGGSITIQAGHRACADAEPADRHGGVHDHQCVGERGGNQRHTDEQHDVRRVHLFGVRPDQQRERAGSRTANIVIGGRDDLELDDGELYERDGDRGLDQCHVAFWLPGSTMTTVSYSTAVATITVGNTVYACGSTALPPTRRFTHTLFHVAQPVQSWGLYLDPNSNVATRSAAKSSMSTTDGRRDLRSGPAPHRRLLQHDHAELYDRRSRTSTAPASALNASNSDYNTISLQHDDGQRRRSGSSTDSWDRRQLLITFDLAEL